MHELLWHWLFAVQLAVSLAAQVLLLALHKPVAHTATACNDVEVFGCAADMMDGCYDEWTAECVALAMASCGLTCG